MIVLTGRERFIVLRGGQRVSVKLRDLDFLQVLALANLHRDDKRLFPALMARQRRMRLAHDRGRVTDGHGGDHNEKRESVESGKASSSVQSVQSMQSVPPGPQKTPEKFSVAADDPAPSPADDFSSHQPAQPASPPVDTGPVGADDDDVGEI